jgi:thiamine transport system substrate-binding protein
VLSYTTSPAYHINAESETRYKAAIFPEGHYMQVEVAGRTIVAADPALAAEFLTFVLSDGFQSHIPAGNWMYPAIAPTDALPEGFEDVVSAEGKALLFPSETVAGKRGEWIDEWLRALSD